MDVGGAPRVLVVTPWIGARLDRDESIAPLAVGQAAAGAGEVRIERRRVGALPINLTPGRGGAAVRSNVPPEGVALPHLDQRVTRRAPVAVEHPAADVDPLTQRLAGV